MPRVASVRKSRPDPSHAKIPPRLRRLRPPVAEESRRRLVPRASCGRRWSAWRSRSVSLCLFAPLIRSYLGGQEPTFVEQIELRVLDWHARLRGPIPPPANVTIVAIDETSLELVGRWPWPRTRTTEIVLRLAEGGARVIALDLILREPDENNRLVLARTLTERFRSLGLDRRARPRDRVRPASRGGPHGRRHRRGARASDGLDPPRRRPVLLRVPAARVPAARRRRLSGSSTGVVWSASPRPKPSSSIHARQAAAVQLPLLEVRHRLGRERPRQRATGRRRRAAPRRAGDPARRRPLSRA